MLPPLNVRPERLNRSRRREGNFPSGHNPTARGPCQNLWPACRNGLSVDKHQLIAHQQHVGQPFPEVRTHHFFGQPDLVY